MTAPFVRVADLSALLPTHPGGHSVATDALKLEGTAISIGWLRT